MGMPCLSFDTRILTWFIWITLLCKPQQMQDSPLKTQPEFWHLELCKNKYINKGKNTDHLFSSTTYKDERIVTVNFCKDEPGQMILPELSRYDRPCVLPTILWRIIDQKMKTDREVMPPNSWELLNHRLTSLLQCTADRKFSPPSI